MDEDRVFPFLPGLLTPADFEPGDIIETDEVVIYITEDGSVEE